MTVPKQGLRRAVARRFLPREAAKARAMSTLAARFEEFRGQGRKPGETGKKAFLQGGSPLGTTEVMPGHKTGVNHVFSSLLKPYPFLNLCLSSGSEVISKFFQSLVNQRGGSFVALVRKAEKASSTRGTRMDKRRLMYRILSAIAF